MRHLYNVIILLILSVGAYAQTCTGPLSVVIQGSGTGDALGLTGEATQPECNSASGTLNGAINISVSGGTLPYSFNWTLDGNPFSTQEDLSGLGTGVYSVTVTDANDCTATDQWEITEPTPVEIVGTPVEPICHENSGSLTGAITLSVTGGTGSYTYLWSTVDGDPVNTTAANQSGLGGGTYCVTVTDANDCTDTECWTLTEPDFIDASEVHTDLTCHPDDYLNEGPVNGTITVTASGGTGTLTYSWSPVSGGIVDGQPNQTGLAAGTYTVTVSDVNSCQEVLTITLTQPDPIVIDGSTTDLACNAVSGAADGAIDITASGGTPAYTYAWTTSDGTGLVPTAQNQTGLSAGSYTVVVTDANGCTQERTFVLAEPTAVTLATTFEPLSCHANSGSPDGRITITPSGGTPGYSYTWSPLTGGINPADGGAQTQLEAGTYDVTVTDSEGCTATASFTLTQPDELVITGTPDEPNCHPNSGNPTGGIDISVAGGTGTMSYAWTASNGGSIPAGQENSEDLSGLYGGTYTVVVTDANLCTDTETWTLTDPSEVVLTLTPTHLLCHANSGSPTGQINASTTGGSSPYTYAWDGPMDVSGGGDTKSLLIAGTYTVTVTDALGCTDVESVTLTEPTEVEATAVTGDLACNSGSGAPTGSINLSVTGGTTPYTYFWDGPGANLVTTQEDQSQLSAGTYTVTVTDANGCTDVESWTLTEPTAVDVTGVGVDPDCHVNSGVQNGTITITPSGGSGTYTYSWTGPGVNANSQNQSNLGAGTYSVTVTDVNDCTAETSFTLGQPDEVVLTLAPTNLNCHANSGAPTGSITASTSGGNGTYSYAWDGPAGVDVSGGGATKNNLIAGTYTVTVTDGLGCSDIESVTLTQPDEVVITLTPTHLICHENNASPSGEISINVVGGNGTYTYAWSGPGANLNSTGSNQTQLSAGTYSVTVTDGLNCTAEASVTLTQIDELIATGTPGNLDCNSANGSPDGSITLTLTGGTSPFTFLWTSGDGTIPAGQETVQNPTGLTAGTYTVVVTDANDCIETIDVTLTQPDPIIITYDPTNPPCNAINTPQVEGAIDITVTGGTGTYTYGWSSPDGGVGLNPTGEDQTQLNGATFIVVVTDASGCTASETIVLTEPEGISVLAVDTDLTCNALNGAADGSITLTVVGGTVAGGSDYTYNWSPVSGGIVQGNQNQTGLAAGTYSVTVSDDNNCTWSATYTLDEPNPIVIDGDVTNLTCNATNASGDGGIDVTVTGGTAPFTYSWTATNGGDVTGQENNEDLTNLVVGTYTLVVTHDGVCTETRTWDLTQPDPLICDITEPPLNSCGDHIDCNGNTVDITVNASGGNPTYTYSIDGTTFQANNVFTVGAGTHTITTRDSEGCETTCEITITEPEPLVAGTCIPEMDECQVGEGEINVEAAGGCPPYTVTWTSPDGGSLDQESGIIATDGGSFLFTGADGGSTYVFRVVDANGCVIGG